MLEDIPKEENKHTTYLQEWSVIAFMEELGFFSVNRNNSMEPAQFSSYYNQLNKISMKTAIKLHNGSFDYYDFNGNLKGAFSVIAKYSLNKARAAKIVENAKLQYSKKKGLIVQSHIVKFVDESYYDIFFD